MTIQEKFQQLIELLPENISSTLRPSANPGAIHIANTRIEDRQLPCELPQSIVDLWLLLDGQTDGASYSEYLFPNFAFLSVPNAISEYSELNTLLRENDPYYDDLSVPDSPAE